MVGFALVPGVLFGVGAGSRRRQRLLLIREEDSLESFLGVQFSAGAALQCTRDPRIAR